jgi:hypothetical protein
MLSHGVGWRYRRLTRVPASSGGHGEQSGDSTRVGDTPSAALASRGVKDPPAAVSARPRYRGPDPHLSEDEIERLRSLKGTFAGERVFVMGNGPSLNKMDLELLAGEHVFGLNRVSLLYPRISWRPGFFTAFDLRVVPDNLDEFNDVEIPYKFFATKHKGAILERDNHYWYHDWSKADDFEDRFGECPEITGFGGGGTVTCVAIQIAAYLGFDPIILIGCDASYTVPASVRQSGPDKFGDGVRLNLTSVDDDDPNHFDPAYFGTNKKWHSPNAAEMHRGFEKCYREMSRRGRTLVNATVGGALDSVPRVDFERLFSSAPPRPRPLVGVDLTGDTARMASGMRTALMADLRNTSLVGPRFRFVAVCPDDDRLEFYSPLASMPDFDVVIDGSAEARRALESLDVLISPFNNLETTLQVSPSTKRVAYLHDLIPLRLPGFPQPLMNRYADVAARADALVCPSGITCGEVSRRFDVPIERCFVAPNAIDDDLTVVPVSEEHQLVTDDDIASVRRQVGVKFSYVVYPAAFRPHKNHRRLFEALRYTYTNLQLVLTTAETHNPAATNAIRELVEQMRLGHRILVAVNLPPKAYRALLKGAEAMIFPSLDEGFGIPVLEAQALRVPVIASRRGALVEVAEGSLEIDPEDHRDIAEKIVQLISDDELKQSVATAGWTNSRRFTKEWGARGLVEAVNFVLADSP